jgi:3-deoxy-manno-octulosonate cytidylyltransferase (CMP-KDO synthetase)
MKVLGVIPARLKSTRFPEKMLALIADKPLIWYTWNQAKKAKSLDALIIATDSKVIYDIAKDFGAEVIMTSDTIQSGSDRTAAALKKFKTFVPDIVVNIQGDEPLIPPKAIDDTVNALKKSTDEFVVATPSTPFQSALDMESPNFVKVVTDTKGKALYFSRSKIPYPRDPFEGYYKHLGLYAYRADFLMKYVKLKQTPLELAEKLEQLRVIEHGYAIKVVKGKYDNMEVNTPEEFERAKNMILKK